LNLVSARKMAAGFKDAVVIHQKSVGHGSIRAVSLCTAKAVRDYFRHGNVPPGPEIECEVESRMFGPPVTMEDASSGEDVELWSTIHELHAAAHVAQFW
jgi:hypothetical protein